MPPLHCRFFVFLLVLLGLVPGSAAASEKSPESGKPLGIFVSILPSEYFVQRIGGDRVRVKTLVQPGHSPATYSPTPKQMADLAAAGIYFRTGVPFENALLPKISRLLPDLSVVNLQQDIHLEKLEDDDEHGHHEGDIDPHTWLDPMLALKQAAVIRDTLAKADPGGIQLYLDNYRQLAADLQELDGFLREALAPYAGSTVYVFHPAYGYLCRAYDLKQKAITPGGREPGAKYIARLIEEARAEGVRVIFVQPQFSRKAAGTIARAIGGTVVELDPLAYDYFANLKQMARQIAQSFAEQE